MISLDDVKDRNIRVGDEFSRGVGEGHEVLLELFTELRDGKNPYPSSVKPYLADQTTHRSVLPEMPISPSGHMLADNVQAYSRVSYINGCVCNKS